MLINWLPAALLSRRSLVRQSATKRKQVSRRLSIEQAETRLVLTAWTELGPAPILNGQIAGGGAVSGRLTGIAADPNDANTIYVASAGGGIWKTTNGGTSWSPMTDNVTDGSGNPIPEFMGSVAETDAVGGAHAGSQIVYAGTGEANNSGDSFYGTGILVSTDGGLNWTLETAGGAFTGASTAKIVIDPTDPTGATAYAAMANFAVNNASNFNNTGIWKTTNFGQTWTNVTAAAPNNLSTSDPWSDVVVDPKTGDVFAAQGTLFGAAGNGVYKSTDGGTTWTLLNGAGSFNGSQDGRITLAIFDQSATDELFVSITDPGNVNFGLYKMLKSTDGGATFTDLTSKVLAASDYLGGQGWYDTTLGIDPTNPNIIYAAGDMSSQGPTFDGSPIMSVDGGTTWQTITTDSNGNGPHTDSHSLAFDKNGNVLEGNDGGIWRLENTGTLATQTWTDLNSNLGTIQFTGIAVTPTGIVYGGSQDNGTEMTAGPLGWTHIADGDGGFTRVDPTNPNIVYSEYAGTNVLQVSLNGGTSFNFIGGPAGSSNFYAPYVLDASGNLYYGGNGLWITKNHGTSFSQIGTSGSNGFTTSGANIDAVAVSQTNNNVVYVSVGGHILVTQNAQNASPTWTTAAALPGGGSVSSGNGIFVDPSVANGSTAYAVVSAFGAQRVFKTTNFGVSWTNITGNLPNTPVWSITTNGSNTLYVGTDIGVYTSTNGGTTWSVMGTGMPQAQVVELEYVAGLNELFAGTHGRGAWSISTLSAPPALTINPSTVTFVSGGGPIALAASASLTGGNASYLGGNLTVQITANGTAASDQLLIQPNANITVVGGTTVKYQGNTIGTLTGGTLGAPLIVTFTTNNATVAAVQALVQAIDFNNTSGSPSTLTRTVAFTVSDGTNVTAPQDVFVNVQLAGPIINFSGVTPITYMATNPPMLLAANATVTDTVTPDYNGGQLDVSISANPSASDLLTVTNSGLITVSGTTVSYGGNAFGMITGGTGATPLIITFNTAFANNTAIQALVRAIAYSNTAVTPSTATRTVSFQLTDSQPVTSAPVTTQVNVQLALPTITLAGPGVLTFTQNGPPLLIAPGSTVTDPLGTLNGGQLAVNISNNVSPGDQLVILNQGTGAGQIGVSGSTVTYGGLTIGTFSGGQAGSPLTITFTTTDATVAAVQALVRDIAFNNTIDPPSNLQRTVTLQLFDAQPAASNPVHVLINVVRVDNAPIINLNAVVATYTEGNPPVTLASGATVTYADDSNFAGGSLTVGLPVNGTPSDQLTIQTLNGITVSGSAVAFNGNVFGTFTGGTNGNPLIISFLNTNATVAATQALIRAIGFSNSAIAPSTLPRTAQFQINDGHGKLSLPVTMTVNVIGVDNSPTLNLGPSLPYLANTPPAAIASSAIVTDPDSPFFTGGSLVVAETFGSPNDLLVVMNQGNGANQIGVSGNSVFDAGTLIGTITSFGSPSSPLAISLNGSATVGDVQDLVRAIGFGITGAASSQSRSFSFTLNDGGGAPSVSQNTSVSVNVGNVPPLVILPPSVNYTAGSPPVTVAPTAIVSDPDSLDFNGGSMSITIAQGQTVNDRLSILNQGTGKGQVLVSGQNVYYSGTLVGTLNNGGGIGSTPLVISFNQQSSAAAAQAILSAVQFSTNGPNSAGPRLLQAIVIDNTHLPSTPAIEQVNVLLPTNPVQLTMSSPTTNYTRGSGPILVDPGATLSDTNTSTFAKGSLTFQVRGGTKNHTVIANTADIQVRNGKVRFDGVIIGTLHGGTVHLNGNATATAVTALIRAVTFSTKGIAGDRTATFLFNDGHGGSTFATRTIIVT